MLLHYSAITHPGDHRTGPCRTQPVRALITPPDETTSLSVAWPSGPVRNRGTLDGSAYFPAGS